MIPSRFQVPASTSNLGAGFDALGLAFNRYLQVSIEPDTTFNIEARGIDVDSIPLSCDNLMLRVARSVSQQRSRSLPPFRLQIENQIPVARGLGSSAAAIIAGITCYELAAGDPMSNGEIFRYAFEFESNPDNLAPALYGGLISAATSSNGKVHVAKLVVASGVEFVAVIPEFELLTERARKVLPETYSRADAVYNIQRAALTVAALTTGQWSDLRESLRDRLHQPYRTSLIPGLDEILNLEMTGLYGVALSGAGPTVLAMTEPASVASVGNTIVEVFARHGIRSTFHVLTIDSKGRSYL